jgi:hypothetical protein
MTSDHDQLPILLARSDALHERVQQFARSLSLRPVEFERLALDIARFQGDAIGGVARLLHATGSPLKTFSDIPAVPVDAFRLTRVAAHPSHLDALSFLTSGTTSGTRGGHSLRRTDTYRNVALAWGRASLIPKEISRMRVVCLAPPPSHPQQSSLGFMMQAFAEEFDGKDALSRPNMWVLSDAGIDIEGLRAAIDEARNEGLPLLILATSFALVFLLDALGGKSLPLDPRSVVMQTGGFKGKSRQVATSELTASVARTFEIDDSRVISEYGMTELSSQLYEGTLPSASFQTNRGWYLPPPWLFVEAVDPQSLQTLPEGSEGLACFTDLANVDSALRILTMDRIIVQDRAVKLLGRNPGSVPRGCSLAIEEILGN